MVEPKVSIIIPVYNVENYLEECLDSVINQTFSDLEIICIDDGSTDNTLNILKSYENIDSRIKVISQENKGVGSARNAGIEVATGKYIYFIDSDDYIYLDAIEEMYEQAERNSSDIVVISRMREEGKDRQKNRDGFNFDYALKINGDNYKHLTFNYKDIKKNVLNTYYNVFMVFYNKEFLDSYPDFVFQEGLIYEDVLFHVKTFLRAERISYIPKAFYFYRKNPNSIMGNTGHNMDIIKVINSVEDFLIENGYSEEFKNELDLFKVRQISLYLISSNSEEYFTLAKDMFSKIRLSDNHYLGESKLRVYNMVLESSNYTDYLNKFYQHMIDTSKSEINNLKKENNKIRAENKKYKSAIHQLENSRSQNISKLSKLFKHLKK